MAQTIMKNFARGLDARRAPIVSGDEVLTRAVDLHVTSAGDLEQRANWIKEYDGHPAVIGYVPHFGGITCVVRAKVDYPELAWNGIRPEGLPGRFTVTHVRNISNGSEPASTPVKIISHTMKGGRGFFVVEYSGGETRTFACAATGGGDAVNLMFQHFEIDGEPEDATRYVRNPLTNKGMMKETEALQLLISNGWIGTRPITKIESMTKFGRVQNIYVLFRDMAGISQLPDEPPVYTVSGGTFDVSTVEKTSGGAIVKYEKIGSEYFVSESVGNNVAYVNAMNAYVYYEKINDYPAGLSAEQENLEQIRSHAPRAVHAIARKLVSSSRQTTMFSGIADPIRFYPDVVGSENPNVGAGFIDMTSEVRGSGGIRGYATYVDRLAVFFDDETQIWSVDVDPANSKLLQTVPGGTNQGFSVLSTSEDVFYADRTGIRSLRARDSSGSLVVDDPGSPINDLIRGKQVISCRDPEFGRMFFCAGDEIFVLSMYPGQRDAAWTTYTSPIVITGAIEGFGRAHIYGEGGIMYAYGSAQNTTPYTYGNSSPEAYLPWVDAGDPTSTKLSKAIDAVVEGTWEVRMCTDPTISVDATDFVAVVDKPTYDLGGVGMKGEWRHIQLRFTCTASPSSTQPARLASVIIHYDQKTPPG